MLIMHWHYQRNERLVGSHTGRAVHPARLERILQIELIDVVVVDYESNA